MRKNTSNKGLTLIEILIGIIITSIMVGAMYTSYNVVSGAYKQVSDKAKISSSSRDLVQMIMRDIRMAGFRYYSGSHAKEQFRLDPNNATCVATGLTLPDRNYIVFNSGFTDGEQDRSHAPLVIRKNVDGTIPELHAATRSIDLCCDRIEIVYEDFRLLEDREEDLLQPFKIYKISYYAKKTGSADNDPRYGVFKKIEHWSQPREKLDDCNWPTEEADLATGDWDDTCPECFEEELVRDHIVDMEFIPFDQDGRVIMDDAKNFPAPEYMNLRDRIFDIRTVDMRLTFRSKNPFYEKDMARDPNDPTKLIKTLRDDGKEPSSYIADTTTSNAQVRTLGETIRLDSRTKLLNPKWYEGMLKSGYEGVRELSNRLNYTLGWSATSGQVDNFVYEETNETFINDEEMRKRLMDLNPNSFRRIVGTLLEVNGRGYWETSDENIEQLKELYQEVEDKIEGVKE